MMKKILLSLGVVGVTVGYVLFQSFGHSDATVATNNPQASGVVDQPVATTPPPSSPTPQPPATTPSSTPKGQYTDGTYVGKATDAYYGTVQVKAIISGGKLTDVQFLQYPNDRGTSNRISQQSMPILRQEAIRTQSASVNNISGATQTTEGFVGSLRSALAQAQA